MRLSEIKGERALEVIADIIDPIASIAEDENAAALFGGDVPDSADTPQKRMIAWVRRSLPTLIRAHKADLISIMSAINGVTVEEYTESMTMGRLVADLYELLTDEDFGSFFA